MNSKYFIEVYETETGYDFVIKLMTEGIHDEPLTLGTRENVENLGIVYEMIEAFPLSPSSELTSVSYNRLNPYLKLTTLEVLFNVSVKALIESKTKNIKEFILN
jgi:hypothetical protein